MLSTYLFGNFNIKEAAVPAEDTEDYTQDDQGAGAPPPADDGNPPPQDQGADQPQPGGEETEDYTQDPDGMPPEGGDQGDYPPEEGGGAPAAPQNTETTADDARGIENQLFSDLTPQQIDQKHQELKNNFVKIFDSTGEIIERINDIPTDENFLATTNFVSTQLGDLREYIVDYIENVYSTKSYMENSIVYNRILVILNQINQVLVEITDDMEEKATK